MKSAIQTASVNKQTTMTAKRRQQTVGVPVQSGVRAGWEGGGWSGTGNAPKGPDFWKNLAAT